MGYIEELRALVGTRPLVLTGVTVLVIDRHSRFLMVESDRYMEIAWRLYRIGGICRRGVQT